MYCQLEALQDHAEWVSVGVYTESKRERVTHQAIETDSPFSVSANHCEA